MVETVGNHRSLPLKGKELRKTNKPLMEKKRRARINTCLNQLKSLVLQAMNKDSSQYSKLEKADILEMTVNYLKAVPQPKTRSASEETVGALAKYNTGFTECAAEVGRYLGTVQGIDGQVRSRVLNHLSHRMNSIQVPHPASHPSAAPSHAAQPSLQPVYVQIPNTTPVIPGVHTAAYHVNTTVTSAQSNGHHQGALVVMPSAVVVPSPVNLQQHWQQQQQQQNFSMPISPPSSTCSSRGSSPVSTVSQTPIPVRHTAPQAVQPLLVPTNVETKSELLWRPW